MLSVTHNIRKERIMASLLQMHDIEMYYGAVKALDGASLEVQNGEVHALLGANGAGKSTLMKILFGELPYNSGTILFNGRELKPGTSWKANDIGISMVHQEISAVSVLTVAQYMYLGREKKKGLFVDDRAIEKDAAYFLKKLGVEVAPDELMGSLTVAQQQLVEIAKAFSIPVSLLVMDEPTTALGEKETEHLFEVIRSLKEQGVSVIYISHKLEEIGQIADRITVMKDGKYVRTLDGKTTERAELIRLLAGHDIVTSKKEADPALENAPVVLEVKDLCTESLLSNVSFSLREGEILGLAGLMGAGRTETAKAICGIDPKLSGDILIRGKRVDIRSPKDAVESGICYLSEDRNKEGMIQSRSIIANSVISSLDRYGKGLSLDDRRMTDDAVAYNTRMGTKYSDPHAPINSLSGGNCQKVIIARWLIRDLPILIFDEPTKGIDVGARDEIYRIIRDIAKNGHSVIMISSETEELLQNCDRIVVMCDGTVSGELGIAEATSEKIMNYAIGGNHE